MTGPPAAAQRGWVDPRRATGTAARAPVITSSLVRDDARNCCRLLVYLPQTPSVARLGGRSRVSRPDLLETPAQPPPGRPAYREGTGSHVCQAPRAHPPHSPCQRSSCTPPGPTTHKQMTSEKTARRDSAIVHFLVACDLTSFTASSHAKENARSGARGPSIPRQCNGKHPSGKATPLLSVATCDYPGISQTGTNPSQCAFTRLLRSADLLPDRRMPAPSTMPPPDRSR